MDICLHKIKYASLAAANTVVAAKRKKGKYIRAYRCAGCGSHHITSSQPKKRRRK